MRVFMTLSPVFVVLAIYWDSALLFFHRPGIQLSPMRRVLFRHEVMSITNSHDQWPPVIHTIGSIRVKKKALFTRKSLQAERQN